MRNIEGSVLLEFTVDEMGFVHDPKVVDSKAEVGFVGAFEFAAVKAAEKSRYAPRFVDGEPVAVEGVRNRIVFEMRD